MKKDLSKAMKLTQEAIQCLSSDFSTLEIRSYLQVALSRLKKVIKNKEIEEKTALEKMIEKGKLANKEWWEKIEENVRKANEEANKEWWEKIKEKKTNTTFETNL